MTAKITERFYCTNELKKKKKSSADITVTSSVYFPDVKAFPKTGGRGVTVHNTMCYFYKLSNV